MAMAFRNEIRDFMDAFNAGSQVVERIKNRQSAEEKQKYFEESDADRRRMAQEAADAQRSQFGENLKLNTRRQQAYEDAQARRDAYNQQVFEENQARNKFTQERQGRLDERQARLDRAATAAAELKARQDAYAAAVKYYNDTLAADPSRVGDPPPNPADYGLGYG